MMMSGYFVLPSNFIIVNLMRNGKQNYRVSRVLVGEMRRVIDGEMYRNLITWYVALFLITIEMNSNESPFDNSPTSVLQVRRIYVDVCYTNCSGYSAITIVHETHKVDPFFLNFKHFLFHL